MLCDVILILSHQQSMGRDLLANMLDWKERNERTKGRMRLVVLEDYPIMITIM